MTAPDSPEAPPADAVEAAESETAENEVVDPEVAPPETADPVTPTEPVASASETTLRWADPTAILTVPDAEWADENEPATALTWVDVAAVGAHSPVASLDRVDERDAAVPLLREARLRPVIARPPILVPLSILAGLVASYCGTALLWPLHEVSPTVSAVEFATVPAPAATMTWPAQGAAGVGIAGMGTVASTTEPMSIASITKVVSSLMVLDRMPLSLGEQGPEFSFTFQDSLDYWSYRRADQSALDVPVGGVLTEYQMLQGTLLGSANNYIDRLVSDIWGSEREFARAAEEYLSARGLEGVTIMSPSGFDERNVATPEALVALGEYAMKNPVFAEIVGTPSVTLPGAGTVENTNGMLADPGVVGIKTGTLVGWNLLTAKDITVGETTVHLYAAVLDQPDDEQRLAATRSLFAEVETALSALAPAVPEGTVVGQVQTVWGETVDVVSDADAQVTLWAGASATASPTFDLGEARDEDDPVGTLTTSGPIDTTTTGLVLDRDIDGPSPWWRLTHPLELFGIEADER